MNSPLISQWLPWVALAIAVFAAAMMQLVYNILRSRALRAEIQAAELEQRLVVLTEQFNALERSSDRTRWEIERLRDEAPMVEKPPVVAAPSGSSNYQHAIKLASRGESVESLVEICALSRGEAELLVKMHHRPAGYA